MFDSWTCLMIQGGPGVIPDNVRTALKIAACELHEGGLGETYISNQVLQGIIKTDWKVHMVGTRAGVLFRAHIDCTSGSDYQVNFLLNQRDLENGADIIRAMTEKGQFVWGRVSEGQVPVEEFYRFENLAGPSRSRH